MTHLNPGANAPLSPQVKVQIDAADADVTALQIYETGKVKSDGDMCFYNQPSLNGGSVTLTSQGTRHTFSLDLARVPSDVKKIVFTATLDQKTFSQVSGLSVSANDHTLSIETQGRTEKALILAEIYLRNGQWKVRNVGQGFNGGLKDLAEHFGVDISDEPAPTPAPTPTPAPEPTPSPALNLTKVSLTKDKASLSLTKDGGKFGHIKVNLDWNQTKSGFLGMKKGIDLDVGALFEFKSGQKGGVQALGNAFGSFLQPPFIHLKGDDRSGSLSGGEWLDINGDMWPHFSRILIYAFIYEGAANWQQTDGVVRVMVPGQPEVEVRMNEETQAPFPVCAVALLENQNDQIKVSREVNFFHGQREMDEFYHWGMNWRAGRK